MPLRRRLPSIPSASVQTDLFRDFLGTMQRSDDRISCIVGDGYALPDAVCAGLLLADCCLTDQTRSSRFPRTMCLCLLRSPTPPSSLIPCQSGLSDIAFYALGPRRHSEVAPLLSPSGRVKTLAL